MQQKADWSSVVGLACAYRDAKKVDEAVRTYRYALTFKSGGSRGAPRRRRHALPRGRSLQAGDRGVRRGPRKAGGSSVGHVVNPLRALPAHRATRRPRPSSLQRGDHDARAWFSYAACAPPGIYVHEHPGPGDATAHAISDAMRTIAKDVAAAQGGAVNLNVTHIESPSVLAAFRLWSEAERINVSAIVPSASKRPTPAPRRATWNRPLGVRRRARPNVPPPDPRAAEAVAAIAREPYNLDSGSRPPASSRAPNGPRLGGEFTFTMVHPPPLPSPDTDPFDWVFRVQTAAALVIAYLDEGWEGSLRKRRAHLESPSARPTGRPTPRSSQSAGSAAPTRRSTATPSSSLVIWSSRYPRMASHMADVPSSARGS